MGNGRGVALEDLRVVWSSCGIAGQRSAGILQL